MGEQRTRMCRRSPWPRTIRRSHCHSAQSARSCGRGRTSRMHLTRRRRQASQELSCLLRERQPSSRRPRPRPRQHQPVHVPLLLDGLLESGRWVRRPRSWRVGRRGRDLDVVGVGAHRGRPGEALRSRRTSEAGTARLPSARDLAARARGSVVAHADSRKSARRGPREQLETKASRVEIVCRISSARRRSPPTAQMASRLLPTLSDHDLRARRQDRPSSRDLGRRSHLLVLCTKLTCARVMGYQDLARPVDRGSRGFQRERAGSPRAACSRVRAPWTPCLRDCD